MKPTHHPNCNDVLKKPAGMTEEECGDQPICRSSEYVTSFWKPSSEELLSLNGGGCVALSIMGATHPPLSVDTCRPHDTQALGRVIDPSEYFHRMKSLNDRLNRLVDLTKRILSAWVGGRDNERAPLTDEMLDSMLANRADGSFVGVHEAIDQTPTATQKDVDRYRADAEGWKAEAERWRKVAEGRICPHLLREKVQHLDGDHAWNEFRRNCENLGEITLEFVYRSAFNEAANNVISLSDPNPAES